MVGPFFLDDAVGELEHVRLGTQQMRNDRTQIPVELHRRPLDRRRDHDGETAGVSASGDRPRRHIGVDAVDHVDILDPHSQLRAVTCAAVVAWP